MSDYIETTFEFQGNTFPLRILTGVVIDANTRSDTHVYGGGTTGSGANMRVESVSSYVEVTKEIWLRGASGKEYSFEFGNLAIRAGNILQIGFTKEYAPLQGFWSVKPSGEPYYRWSSLNNLATGKGWTAPNVSMFASTIDQKPFNLVLYKSSAVDYLKNKNYLKNKFFFAYTVICVLLLIVTEGAAGAARMLMFFLLMFLIVVFVAAIFRRGKNLAPSYIKAADTACDQMRGQHAAVIEQLKSASAKPALIAA